MVALIAMIKLANLMTTINDAKFLNKRKRACTIQTSSQHWFLTVLGTTFLVTIGSTAIVIQTPAYSLPIKILE